MATVHITLAMALIRGKSLTCRLRALFL